MIEKLKLLNYRSVRLAVGATVFTALFEVLMSYSLSFLVTSTVSKLIRNVLFVLGIYLIYAIGMYLQLKLKGLANYYVSQDIKQQADKWIANLSYQDYHEKDHGEWLSIYVNDVPKVIELTLTKFLSMTEKASVTVFVFVALTYIHYSMALLALLSLAFMTFIPRLFQKNLAKYILQVQNSKEIYLSKMRELLQGFDTFLENTAFNIFLKKSRQASFNYSKAVYNSEKFTSLMSACLTFTNAFVTVIALGLLSYNVINGRVQTGAFLSVSSLLPTFGASVMEFLSEKEFFQSGQTLYSSKFSNLGQFNAQEDFFTKSGFIHAVPMPTDQFSSQEKSISELALEKIVLIYQNKEIRFPEKLKFLKGKKYAIIGESGCGKSSLLKIIMGEITDYQGDYKIDNKGVSGALFDSLSYVNQTTFLFNDTIRHNIDLLGKHSDDDLKKLLTTLHLEYLSLDEKIEDNGKNLSGGQRQRLSIARALLRNKDILLLDEATANLDKETAEGIEQYILSTECMVIMISHHLSSSTEKSLDKVLKLG
ncbi:ATP-binding cassette domain-containing protein [Streptococcus orisratti]|uniref:ATP-binding cassette domain-containing protein n=1 Tax=Streptococcus orisratti TaxID=114652 RepID=UPI0023F7B103|nr:ABC transporter ATP-binding protein [Streptococcus orisratti]MDY4002385.1 ABC transporter ATP-binding protein [Streptococcus orisratti]MDY5636896.1 ABC transporter ATP-binding protein [Streptococcus orisratti]